MKNIIFRVDSGFEIGSGHLMRCVTLAKNLEKQGSFRCMFLTRPNDGNFTDIIVKSGFRVILLVNDSIIGRNSVDYVEWLGTSQEHDASQCLKALEDHEIDILVVDHYALDIQWEMNFVKLSKKIVVIDDLANRKHCCDIILDQNMAPDYLTRYDNLVPKKCKKFTGISYCLLRDDFIRIKKSINVRKKMKSLLIFFGGVDKDNATLLILIELEGYLNKFIEVKVVVGQHNPFRNLVKGFCDKYDNCTYLEQVDNMAELMAKADISIGAGGATTGERIFLGLPSIVFSLADNQVEVSKYLHEKKYICYLGDQDRIKTSNIIAELEKFMHSPNLLQNESNNLLKIGESQLRRFIYEIVSFNVEMS